MTAPTNVASYSMVGSREDFENTIYRVQPEKTPFISAAQKKKATARFHEWQTETLDTVSTSNAQLEGDDVGTLDAANNTTRVGTYAQIFRKTFGVTRTQELVDKAGRKSEINRQKVLKGIALRRDMEATMLGAKVSGQNESGSNPRKTGSILCWLTSNVSRGASGASGGFSGGVPTAPTDGTLRTFTESLLKTAWATAFNNGAEPSIAYMSATQKQEFSAFTGIADIRAEVKGREQATIIAGAEVYVGDFGQLMLVPHPYALTRDVVVVDPEYVAVATLDGFKTEELSKTGDSTKYMMTHEAAFEVQNERAHFVIADVQ